MSLIDPRIHKALDGEVRREALPPELEREVERLERAAALLRAAPVAPESIETRVMHEVRRPVPTRARRLAFWFTTRHSVTVRVRPIWSVALAAAVAAVALFPSGESGPVLGREEGVAQFVVPFPGARSVDVVGSFNDWRPGLLPLTDQDHDGVWRAAVVLPAGQHEYMFVVDGERWVADPLAGRYVADGFGRENALLIVRPTRR